MTNLPLKEPATVSSLLFINIMREHKTAESIIKIRANKATQLITGVEDDFSTDDEIDHDDTKNESGTVKLFRKVHKAAKCHHPNDCVK